MSQWALLLSCRDVLRARPGQTPPELSGLGLSAVQCDCNFDGQPTPICGELFVAVHPLSWTANDTEGLDEFYDIGITITVRMSVVPSDRQTTVTPLSSIFGKTMAQQLERIRALLHLDSVQDQWLNRANYYIDQLGSGGSGFVEPPRLRSVDLPQPRGAEWFSATRDVSGQVLPCGLSQQMTFGGARRAQRMESEE